MHDEHPHPLLAQVPLTISPFLSLPTSVPLPYSYKTLPSTLPASILQQPQQQQQQPPSNQSQSQSQSQSQPESAAYVLSAAGTSSTPDAILTSCLALQTHLAQLEADARQTLQAWEERRRKEDLAEKRRVAPGWLDSGVHILKPEEEGGGGKGGGAEGMEVENIMDDDPQQREVEKGGEELDRVFGGLKV